MERLQKILSAAGICSRRQAENYISAGRVTVNGVVASLGDQAYPGVDRIELDGTPVGGPADKKYLMLNKPRGYVTTLSDEKGRPAVAELVRDCDDRVYPVGRLDMDSEGLLLLTNDGDLANGLMHPGSEVNKTYEVWVTGFHTGSDALLQRPIMMDGRPIRKPEVRLLSASGGTAHLHITIHEGRNRQVRRMCQAAGMRVTRLRRIAEGTLSLGDLKKGTWRYLTQQELAELKKELQF